MTASGQFPPFERICEQVSAFVGRHAGIARAESLGESEQGREVLAVEVTDPAAEEEDKQVALVVCGRHGQELGTRVVGPALLEWLASPPAAETRRGQRVFVVPVANPDGCVREQFHAPSDRLSELEERTILALAERVCPDAVVDVHSLGGSDTEAVIAAHTTRCAVDELIHHTLAAEMAEAAGRRGYPFDVEAVPFPDTYNNHFCGACYERFHCLAFGMEVSHLSLGPAEAAESGVAAIVALLEAGNRRRGWQARSGYPNEILIGNFSASIRPAGANAAERSRSREEIWRHRGAFAVPQREMPDRDTLKLTVRHEGHAPTCAWSLCCRLRGRRVIRGVRLDGRGGPVCAWQDACSTYVRATVPPAGPQAHELIVQLEPASAGGRTETSGPPER